MKENKTANKNTNAVYEYYVKFLLSKLGNIEDLANETICLFCMGNTKFIKYVKSICKSVIVIDEFCFDDTIYDCKAFRYINNIEAINAIFKQIEEIMGEKIKYIVMNPPFSLGNEIVSTVKEYLTDDGKAVIIMPLNQYKGKDLFKHIEQFELADPKVFDAVITENLNISTVTKKKQNKFNWQELVLESCDQNFRKFYDWNITNTKNIIMKQMSYKNPEDFDVYLDFWETCKCFSSLGGGGFGSNGGGYKWNVLYDNSSVNAGIGHIHFNTKQSKDNFCKYWYNGKKGESLSSRMALGIHMGGSVGPNTAIAIPQIDWETIDQHPLWNTDVDAAVLDTMGLKWDDNKEKIIAK